MLKALGKVVGALLALGVLLFIVILKFSVIESRYRCDGTVTKEPYQSEETMFTRLGRYRWWVGFWSDSYGNLHTEIPHQSIEYYSHIAEVGDILQIFSAPNKLEGQFSTLSKSLTLKTPNGLFEGACLQIKDYRP